MEWLYYLLEANLYLVLFYGFYRLFLHNETFYNLNRYFLLLSTIISFALPILQIGVLRLSIDQMHSDYLMNSGAEPPPPMMSEEMLSTTAPIADTNWFYVFYLLIAAGFALKLSFSIYKIIKIWIKAKKHTSGPITLIEVTDQSTAFSFFNLLFIHPQLADSVAVLKHEMVHIKQKHSFDILFFELIQIICWFSPILPFIKKDIKLLHEYIADELTTGEDVQKHEYALFLIQNSFGLTAQPITNQIFNQSILKRRINMLNKKRTAGWARLRLLLALPLTGAMLCTSTMAFTKDYGYIDLLPEKSEFVAPIQENPKVENIKKSPAIKIQNVKRDQIKFPPPIVRQDKDRFTPRIEVRASTQQVVNTESRYIVINGKPLKNSPTFYGVTNTKDVIYLNSRTAVKKYGDVAKFGAVEIIGDDIKYVTDPPQIVPPPPLPPKQDQIKFPPPIVKRYQNYFTPNLKKENENFVGIDKRYIVINGNPIEDNSKFIGVKHSETVTYLSPMQAIKTYGQEKGKYGAVEIIGANIYFNQPGDQIKFPPPIVTPDKPRKTLKTPPPPVEPPPPNYKPKKRISLKIAPPVEPPPPRQKTDQAVVPPPVPVEPSEKPLNIRLKRDQVVLKPLTNKTEKVLTIKLKEGEPVKQIEKPINIRLKQNQTNLKPLTKETEEILSIKLKEGETTSLKKVEIHLENEIKKMANSDERLIPTKKVLEEVQIVAKAKNK